MTGQTVGHYKILELLGRGGMGEVYRAEDTSLDREVALKVLPSDLSDNPDRLARFEREAKTLATLNHPNIVTIHTVEEADGVHFLTMELVEGDSLDQLILPEGLPLEQFFDLAVPLADALSEAHEQGIIHRDLKPANIVIDHKGRPKVLDFGLAKLRQPTTPEDLSQLATEVMTQEGAVLGTYPYMSPEQAEGKVVDHRSDIFSFGTLLYEMSTGVRPFQGDSPVSLMSSILRDTPKEVDLVRNDLPHHLSRITSRCLAKDPDDRYQRAKELRRDLDELRSEGVPDQSLSTPRVTRQILERRWFRTGKAAAIFILIAVAAAAYWAGLWEKTVTPAPGVEPQISSLAVLPLDNLSGNPDQDYLAAGIHEALITELARLGSLDKLVARGSVMVYKENRPPLPEIGQQLRVEAVIEGAVQSSGERLSLTARLIRAKTEETLWANRFQGELGDLLTLQNDLVDSLAQEVLGTIDSTSKNRERVATVDPEAHRSYLKARYRMTNVATAEGFQEGMALLRRALEIDATYAPAYASLSLAYLHLGATGINVLPPGEVMPKAKAAALKAVELDDWLSEAHTALANVHWGWDWDWEASEREFRRAIELNPSDSLSRAFYSQFLSYVAGEPDRGLEEARLAMEVDPLDPFVEVNVLFRLYEAGLYDEGLERTRLMLQTIPEFWIAYWCQGKIHSALGNFEQAIASLEAALDLSGRNVNVLASLGNTHGQAGRTAEAIEVLKELEEQAADGYLAPAAMVYVYAGLEDIDAAVKWLEKVSEERADLSFLARDPTLESMRQDSRIQEILERLALPNYP